jgi:hypothetical protein
MLTKLANALISKMEIGAPMAAMYLLENPDHYTNHQFVKFYWKSYVNEVLRTSPLSNSNPDSDMVANTTEPTVMITKKKNTLSAFSPIYDYIYRAPKYNDICLYDWVRLSTKKKGGLQKITKQNNRRKSDNAAVRDSDDDDNDDDNINDSYNMDNNEIYKNNIDSECESDQEENILLKHIKVKAGQKRKRDDTDFDNDSNILSELYLEPHPQRDTHQSHLLSEKFA